VLQTSRHPLQAQHVERCKRDPETDESKPEGRYPIAPVQAESEGLGEPELHSRKDSKHHPADDDVVEMSYQEHGVVRQEVGRRHGKQHAREPADDEGEDEPHRPQHRDFEANSAPVHCEARSSRTRARANSSCHDSAI
jgi:hypothetical protein